MGVLILLRWILLNFRSFNCTVHPGQGHRLGIFSDILSILSTLIGVPFELFSSKQAGFFQ